jgi:hypothetical protein
MNFSKRKADVSIIRERYQNKEKRDARAKDLVEVYGAHVVKRSSQRSVVLHPEYVRDWEGEVRSGFGNDQYKTFFPAIYTVEADI